MVLYCGSRSIPTDGGVLSRSGNRISEIQCWYVCLAFQVAATHCLSAASRMGGRQLLGGPAHAPTRERTLHTRGTSLLLQSDINIAWRRRDFAVFYHPRGSFPYYSSLEASCRSARADVCRRVTGLYLSDQEYRYCSNDHKESSWKHRNRCLWAQRDTNGRPARPCMYGALSTALWHAGASSSRSLRLPWVSSRLMHGCLGP